MLDRSSITYQPIPMNKLSIEKRTQLISCLIEGSSIRATSRMTGVAFNTVLRFVSDIGRVCSIFQDETFRNLNCKRLECDEIWAFCGAKAKNTSDEKKAQGWGDVWTWTAIDVDTKLVPCWFVGGRDAKSGQHFMNDLADRLTSRVQLTTDSHKAYLSAVDNAFGNDIDYAQLVKIYGSGQNSQGQYRYSPAQCMGTRKAVMTGQPKREHISTSIVERQNLTMRMSIRRFTRLTNAHSKKLENHEHAVALHFMNYNFCRIHQTLRVTPAMQAGLTDRVWELADIADLLDVAERRAA